MKKIREALKKGELIIDLKDKRKYPDKKQDVSLDPSKPIIVISESKTGRNELFFDHLERKILSVSSFIALIEKGKYPGYTVKVVRGIPTPVSNPDDDGSNNLT